MGRIDPRRLTTRDGRSLVVRTAHPDDSAPVVAMTLDVIAEGDTNVTETDEFTFTEAQEARYLQAHLDEPCHLAIVAESDAGVVGFLGFENGPRRRIAHRGTLHMTVAADWRGVGVGTALIEALLAWAVAHPVIEKVCLAVLADNEWAIGLYRKLGFVEEGRRPREVRRGADDYVDDLLMYRLLR